MTQPMPSGMGEAKKGRKARIELGFSPWNKALIKLIFPNVCWRLYYPFLE
jgi:hypothetical protein